MGKMTELQDFYQCHEAGRLFEMRTNYIMIITNYIKIDPKDTEEVSGHHVHTAAVLNTSKIQSRMLTL